MALTHASRMWWSRAARVADRGDITRCQYQSEGWRLRLTIELFYSRGHDCDWAVRVNTTLCQEDTNQDSHRERDGHFRMHVRLSLDSGPGGPINILKTSGPTQNISCAQATSFPRVYDTLRES